MLNVSDGQILHKNLLESTKNYNNFMTFVSGCAIYIRNEREIV